MGRWLLVLVALAACGSRKPAPPTAAADALWDLAPDGTRIALVVSPRGVATIGRSIGPLRALFATPDLAELTPKLDYVMTRLLGKPGRTLAESGVAEDRGLAVFVMADGKAVEIVPVGDRDKWLAAQGGKRGGSGDTVGDRTCKDVHGVYACASDAAQLDHLGGGKLRSKLALVGERGEVELYAAEVAPFADSKGELAVIARLTDGAIDVRGRWRGKPDGIAAALAATSAPPLDASGASGFARANVMPLLGDANEMVVAAGVTARELATSLKGPIRMIVPAGSVDLQIHMPLADPAPATKLIEHCEELPLPRATTQTPGACRLGVQLASPLELDTWVENGELRVAAHKGTVSPGQPGAMTPVGRELATGDWSVAFWGRGTLLNGSGLAPMGSELPLPAARAIHLMALVDELGAAVAFERDGMRFRVYARTVYANAPEVAAKLAAIDGNAIASGKATDVAKPLADASPGTPFAADYAAGQGGLMIPAAIASVIAAVAIDRVTAWFEPEQASNLPPPMDETQLTRVLLLAYTQDAFPRWRAEHAGKTCPASLDELAGYLHVDPDIPTRTDPWGHALVMHCDAKGFTILSVGPDGTEGTADDVHP
jgi:hypothetical protein